MNEGGDKLKLLIVEDDAGLRKQLQWALFGHELFLAEDRKTALTLFRREEPPVVILDLGLPPDPSSPEEGLATLHDILAFRPHTKVIISSGNEDRRIAVEAVRSGAYDFYAKPADQDVLKVIIDRAWNSYRLESELDRIKSDLREEETFHGVVAASPEMAKVCRLAERVAAASVSVLITGETGCGKDMLARAIHAESPRRDKPFVAINCAAIPENLLESELFGHEKGAFTGALSQVIGKIETASGGTLFLDEIGDMPLELQAKLLRFLQERVIERIGGRKTIPVDVRVLSATNKDLAEMMKAGTFREDLYFRLCEVTVAVPPLRERPGDAVLLANHVLKKAQVAGNRVLKGFSREALELIEGYAWPGNVRELENRVRRAMVMADQSYITPADLDLPEGSRDRGKDAQTLREIREEAEKNALVRALALTGNNIQEAAKLLGVSRPTLYALMKTLNITR